MREPTLKQAKCVLTFLATTVRLSSSLTTSINLRDPSLLRTPSVTFHRESLQVFDPAATNSDIKDGSAVVALVEVMNRADAKKAIDISSRAFKKWRFQTTAIERSAKIMTLESGKPINESIGEVGYGTSFLDYYAAEAISIPFSNVALHFSRRGKVMVVQEPVGVTALITPWNFPIAMITRKVAPALAAGCTVVLKPSEVTPLTAIAVKQLANRAGIPDEVFQLVVADKNTTPEIGEEFCTNPVVKKISFTGSTAVGKLLMKLSSETVKRLSLELGGNAPFIVFKDADIDQAVNAAMSSKFRNAGQTCVSSDRFIIHKDIEDDFIRILSEKVTNLQIGSGLSEEINIGPLIKASAATDIKEKIDEAINQGAEVILGGDLLEKLGPNFLQPTILRNVDTSSRIWLSETFGPVVAITTFLHEDEAVNLANDSSSGLASYFCSKDLARVFRVAERLENGLVGINEGIISTAIAPFGGMKESGLGREGSPAGIAEYLETKYVFLNF
eukprot:scaffold656_cov271-Chaetoceros_neogracile.AAC.93